METVYTLGFAVVAFIIGAMLARLDKLSKRVKYLEHCYFTRNQPDQ